jgi:hypothetical protein
MEKVDPKSGRAYFKPVKVNLRCTDASCRRADGEMCWHVAHLIPAWHTIAMHEAARNLLSDSPAVRDRELMGQVSDEGIRQFRPELVDAAFAPPATPATGRIMFAVVAVDPNNCGSSEYAIASAVYTSDKMVIVGMDTTADGNTEKHEQLFRTHVQALEKTLNGAHVYLAVEANMGADAPGVHEGWMLKMGLTRAQFTSLRERGGTGKRVEKCRGIWTSASFKRSATVDFRDSLRERRVRLAHRAFSVEGREFRRDACEQLKRWTEFVEPPRTVNGSEKRWISGKGKTGALQDDLAMVLIINHAVSRMLMGIYGAKYNVAELSRSATFADD